MTQAWDSIIWKETKKPVKCPRYSDYIGQKNKNCLEEMWEKASRLKSEKSHACDINEKLK